MVDEIFGREAALDSIRSVLESGGWPVALVIHGEAGIGKTAVWKQGLALASEMSYRVLRSRPAETERRLSYSVLGDLLDDALDESLASLPEPQREALEVALLRRTTTRSRPDHRAISLAALGVLRALARSASVVLAVDDVQWADPPSVRVLQFAIRRLKEERLAILLAMRGSEERDDPFGLIDLLPEDRVKTLPMRGLSVEALGRILRSRLGLGFARPVLVQLQKISGGNPFYALEIARAMQRGEQRATGQLPMPQTLTDAIGDHLRALPGRTRAALTVAAALSRPTTTLIASGLGGRMSKGTLSKAVEAGVVDLDGESIRFSHPLFGSVIYSKTSEEERRRLHHKLASIVHDPEERAWHLALSVEGPDAAVAGALDEAAETAHVRGAPDSAAELKERARRLTPAGEPAKARRRMVEAADLYLEAGDSGRARALLEEAVAEAPSGAERARTLIRLAWAQTYQDGEVAAIPLFTEVLAEPDADLATEADAEHGLAWCIHVRDVPRAQEHARSAVTIARKLGDPHVLAEALAVEAFIDALSGLDVSVDALDLAVGREDRSGQTRPLVNPAWILNMLLQWQGDQLAAKERLDRLYRDARERGNESSMPYILHHLARVECRLGHWQEAARLANEGYELTLQTGQVNELPYSLFSLALVHAHEGNADSARAEAEEGLELASQTVSATIDLSAVLGFLDLSLGNAAEAHRRLAPIVEALDTAGVRDPAVFRIHPDLIEALISLGKLEEAEELLGPFEERAIARNHAWAMPVAGRCRGLLLSARGDLEAALLRLEAAVHDHERLPEPFELARTLHAKGVVERRGKRKRGARASLERALAIFDDLGAALWSERVRAELGRIGGRAPTPLSLTPTEERVAELVSAGSTNREVADRLFISVNTVEANLKRIFRKLGIRSRTQLSARMRSGSAGAGTADTA